MAFLEIMQISQCIQIYERGIWAGIISEHQLFTWNVTFFLMILHIQGANTFHTDKYSYKINMSIVHCIYSWCKQLHSCRRLVGRDANTKWRCNASQPNNDPSHRPGLSNFLCISSSAAATTLHGKVVIIRISLSDWNINSTFRFGGLNGRLLKGVIYCSPRE